MFMNHIVLSSRHLSLREQEILSGWGAGERDSVREPVVVTPFKDGEAFHVSTSFLNEDNDDNDANHLDVLRAVGLSEILYGILKTLHARDVQLVTFDPKGPVDLNFAHYTTAEGREVQIEAVDRPSLASRPVRMLDLSTGHVTQDDIERIESGADDLLHAEPYAYGVHLHASLLNPAYGNADATRQRLIESGYSLDLIDLLSYAHEKGIDMIRLDRDADSVDVLPHHDWDDGERTLYGHSLPPLPEHIEGEDLEAYRLRVAKNEFSPKPPQP